MTKLQIVQLVSGKFAIRRRHKWVECWEFVDLRKCTDARILPEYILKYCLVDTVEQAEMLLSEIIKAIKAERHDELKIVKIIKTVKV